MSTPEHDLRIDYIEIPATDVAAMKRFYGDVFGWATEDYGPDYASFADGRMTGGFSGGTPVVKGGPLVVIFAVNLDAVAARIQEAGGRITRETFEFPGGRRFHFEDPSGNELAVWSDR